MIQLSTDLITQANELVVLGNDLTRTCKVIDQGHVGVSECAREVFPIRIVLYDMIWRPIPYQQKHMLLGRTLSVPTKIMPKVICINVIVTRLSKLNSTELIKLNY